MLKAGIIPVTPFKQNCSLIWCDETNKGALVDPGGEVDRIMHEVAAQKVDLEKIMVTHGHMDHAGGVAEIAERFGLPIEGPHKDDLFLIEKLAEQGAKYGITSARPFTPDRWLEHGDQVTLGNLIFDVIHCPGHTPGHVVFHQPENELALVGDVLFRGSVGRCDLPRGNHMDLINSIRERLWPLGNDVAFISGHGQMSTFGEERQHNAYVSDFVEY
jgi:hydroxyacylglutathione hydrolase